MIYEDPALYERQALPEEFYTATLEAIIDKYKVKTAIDYGCGLGVDVAMMLGMGLDAYGLDGSEAMGHHVLFSPYRYRVCDLRDVLDEEVDLIWCREVAEHLPRENAERLVENIANNCRVTYFTAAPPGQVGYQHVNPQFPAFWIDLFHAHGFKVDAELTALNGEHPNSDDRLNGMVLAP